MIEEFEVMVLICLGLLFWYRLNQRFRDVLMVFVLQASILWRFGREALAFYFITRCLSLHVRSQMCSLLKFCDSQLIGTCYYFKFFIIMHLCTAMMRNIETNRKSENRVISSADTGILGCIPESVTLFSLLIQSLSIFEFQRIMSTKDMLDFL